VTDVVLYRVVADSPPRIDVSQPECPRGSIEPPRDATPGTPPTPIYHDPHPPFETDGRGRVVWSNSSEQARLRSRSSPPVQPPKSANDETSGMREKENGRAADPRLETRGCGNGDCNGDEDGGADGVTVEVL